MSRSGRITHTLLVAAMVMPAVACTSESSSDGGERVASCAYRVIYQDRTYRDVANVEFRAGEKLGPATVPPCDDTGGQNEGKQAGRQRPPTRWTASLPRWPSQSGTLPAMSSSWPPTWATSSPGDTETDRRVLTPAVGRRIVGLLRSASSFPFPSHPSLNSVT